MFVQTYTYEFVITNGIKRYCLSRRVFKYNLYTILIKIKFKIKDNCVLKTGSQEPDVLRREFFEPFVNNFYYKHFKSFLDRISVHTSNKNQAKF